MLDTDRTEKGAAEAMLFQHTIFLQKRFFEAAPIFARSGYNRKQRITIV